MSLSSPHYLVITHCLHCPHVSSSLPTYHTRPHIEPTSPTDFPDHASFFFFFVSIPKSYHWNSQASIWRHNGPSHFHSDNAFPLPSKRGFSRGRQKMERLLESPSHRSLSLTHFNPRYYQWELPYSCVELNLVHGDLLRLRSTTLKTPNWEAPMDRTRVVSGLYRQFNISLSIPYIPAKDIVSLIIGPSYPTRSAAVLLCRWRPRHCVRLRWKEIDRFSSHGTATMTNSARSIQLRLSEP